mgnify:FL=1
MAQTLTVAGSVACPFEDGGTAAPISLAATLVFTSRADFARSYSGAVTDEEVDFGTLTSPGAKGILVKCTTGSCTVKFQANTTPAWPLAAGGCFLWINIAQASPTTAFITTTGSAAVVFLAVG